MTQEASDKVELWLFTISFPYGAEESFLENELPVLAQRFKAVKVLPMYKVKGRRELPENATLIEPTIEDNQGAGLFTMLRWALRIMPLLRSIRHSAPSKDQFRERRPELISQVRQYVRRARELEQAAHFQQRNGRVLFYSYWAYDWVVILSLLKKRDPSMTIVSRVHGFDLYEERDPSGWFPFRSFQLMHLDLLVAASDAGAKYLHKMHPKAASKFALARLGTQDHGLGPFTPKATIHVISCSNVVPLKRLGILVEALRLVRSNVRWTHIGDGSELPSLRNMIASLPDHVEVDFLGRQTNVNVIELYRQRSFDLFLHMSSTEGGVPVALQEAASFGIPLLAADVGGVSEVVCERTGMLLGADPTPMEVARVIDGLRSSKLHTQEFRAEVRAYWKENFLASKNYDAFCDQLFEVSR